MMTAERLCAHIIRLLHAPIHVYTDQGVQTAVYVDHGEQQDILSCDRKLLELLLEKGRSDHPVLYLETEEIIYGVVPGGGVLYILGPCCLGRDTLAAEKFLKRRHKLDPAQPYRISVCPLMDFCELTSMLYEHLTGKPMEASVMLQKSFCDERFEAAMREKVHQVFCTMQETSAVHNPYAQELREQESIRAGDLDALYRSFEETYVGKIGTLSPDPLRNAKNLAIVLVTLASRSAIAGGMLPEVVFSMSDAYIQRAEEMKNPGEALALGRQAEVEYCTEVGRLSSGSRRSALVVRCKDLIVQQLHSKLTVQTLAQQLDVAPDYLSHLFNREEGIRLSEYIAREKINSAKNHLVYTEDSYGSLAFLLGYSSQSHFIQAFRKQTGMTPKQYREQYGRRLS